MKGFGGSQRQRLAAVVTSGLILCGSSCWAANPFFEPPPKAESLSQIDVEKMIMEAIKDVETKGSKNHAPNQQNQPNQQTGPAGPPSAPAASSSSQPAVLSIVGKVNGEIILKRGSETVVVKDGTVVDGYLVQYPKLVLASEVKKADPQVSAEKTAVASSQGKSELKALQEKVAQLEKLTAESSQSKAEVVKLQSQLKQYESDLKSKDEQIRNLERSAQKSNDRAGRQTRGKNAPKELAAESGVAYAAPIPVVPPNPEDIIIRKAVVDPLGQIQWNLSGDVILVRVDNAKEFVADEYFGAAVKKKQPNGDSIIFVLNADFDLSKFRK